MAAESTKPFAVRFETLGCRLNQLETETIAEAFLAEGFSVADFPPQDGEAAPPEDERAAKNPRTLLCIINTCAVTGKAEQKARRLIRLARKRFPRATVIVTGCYAQTDFETLRGIDGEIVVLPGQRKDTLKKLPATLNRRLGNTGDPDVHRKTAEIVRAFCAEPEQTAPGIRRPPPAAPAHDTAAGISAAVKPAFAFHSRALVKIQDGCSNRCSFCKTRIARGPSVSVPASEIVSRIQEIEKAGWGEVVLTGINLHQYADPERGTALPGLLRTILGSTGKIFVRVSSLYPESVTEEFVSVVRNDRVCPFFHLSIQSGSPRIINRMRRQYSPGQVKTAVEKLRDAKVNPFVSCDIITGFPGETDGDFSLTERLCREIGFAHIHVFPFSPREGTEAAEMRPRVPERVSRERAAVLEALSAEGGARYAASWIGKELPAILEYSPKLRAPRAHTVNSLSLPLALEKNRGCPPGLAETIARDPGALRGAPILVKIQDAEDPDGSSVKKPCAYLVKALF